MTVYAADVLWLPMEPMNPSAGGYPSYATQMTYRDTMKAVAVAKATGTNMSAFLDVWQRLYDFGAWGALQAGKSVYYKDDLHLSALGNFDKAKAIADALLPSGVNGPL